MLQFQKPKSSPSDNCRMLLFSMIVVGVVVLTTMTAAASAMRPHHHSPDAMMISNNEALEQQLANEKMRALGVASSFQDASPSNQKYMEHYHHLENDLSERPEVAEQPAAASMRMQQAQELQQQQQQQQQKMLNQGVINGNHATYVEPPADFKPIIYGLDDGQSSGDVGSSTSGLQQADSSGESLGALDSLMLNQLIPAANSDNGQNVGSNHIIQSHKHQQQLNNPYVGGGSDGNGDNQRPSASESHVEYHNKPQSTNQQAAAAAEDRALNPYQQQLRPKQQQQQRWEKDLAQATNEARLKPSIGRWSDWYDLGIEPDLATSDTLGSNQYSALPGQQASNAAVAASSSSYAAKVPYVETRLAGAPAVVPSDTETPVAWNAGQMVEQMRLSDGVGGQTAQEGGQQQNLVHHQHQNQHQQQQIHLKQLMEQVNFMPTNGFQPQQQHQQQQELDQQRHWTRPRFVPGNLVKRLAAVAADFRSQIMGSPSSAHAMVADPPVVAAPPPASGIKAALNNWMGNLNNQVELQQSQQSQQQQNEYKVQNFNQLQDKKAGGLDKKQPPSPPPQQQGQVKGAASKQQRQWQLRKMRKLSQYQAPKLEQQPSVQQQAIAPTQWGQQVPMPSLKQQTKHSTQQTVRPKRGGRQSKSHNAEVEIMQLVANSIQQELFSSPKQVNGLVIYHDQRYNQPQQWQQQQPQQQLQLQQQQMHLQQQQMHRLQKQQQQRQVDPVPKQQQQQLDQRVQPAPANAKQRQQPTMAPAKRLEASTNSSLIKRQVKRRRVKTLLPVGLSSWFLGGIRDLDGRHWHLPDEVISRLAVNDVDFVGHHQAPKVVPPSAGSVVLIGGGQEAGNNNNTTTPATIQTTEQTPQVSSGGGGGGGVRVPIRRVVPR